MGKKKPFIDKKHASTYHVLHRSQRDVSQHILSEGDTDAAGFILWPAVDNNPETNQAVLGRRNNTEGRSGNKDDRRMQEWREKLKQSGLLDDRGEREKYMKEITGSGTFLSASGQMGAADAFGNVRHASAISTDIDILEVKNQLENIPVREALDEDLAAILYGDTDELDFDAFEDLNDEFVLDAAKPAVEDETGFDYDAHIQKLMEKARAEREGGTLSLSDQPGHEWALKDQDFFSKAHALRELENEDDDDSFANIPDEDLDSKMASEIPPAPGAAPKLSPDEEKALCEKFEETLLEYDSDEIGYNPEEEIEGRLPLEGDTQIEAALDDYLQEKEDDIFMRGRQSDDSSGGHFHQGGSGFSALVGTRMVPAKELDALPNGGDVSTNEPIQQRLAQAKDRLKEPIEQPPPEEILIDGQSYFSERKRNPWDCESILSTYTNLDNNPVTIQASRKRNRRREKGKMSEDTETLEQIQLSNKTGLPLGVLSSRQTENDDNDDDFTGTVTSVNKGEARTKKESAAEKKARKAAVKRERQMARIQKKVTREVFQEEFAKQAVDVGGDHIAGKSVFKYS